MILPAGVYAAVVASSQFDAHSEAPPPTAGQIRRAVTRAERGQSISVEEAVGLLAARGDELDRLLTHAAELRNRGVDARGLGRIVTYSPKVFLPLTRLCRDSCHYCTFVQTPAALRRAGHSMFLEPDEVLQIARQGAQQGCLEALFTLGDRPEDRWPAAKEWLDHRGYDSTLAYVRAMAILVLEETGLLPHLNPGVMTWEELARLRPVAPSMGMMLETTSQRLWSTPGLAHYGSPDKEPAVRLRVLEDAGRLAIPFTSGVLVGIGETPTELVQSLLALRSVAREHGHIQEVIVQNFRAKPTTAMAGADDLGEDAYLATLATARVLLGTRIRIQAPPNLSDPGQLERLLAAGVDDWGGISPVTADHVNPERPWPHIDVVRAATEAAGFELRPRLTAHPEYVSAPQWIDRRLSAHVRALSGPGGLAVPDVKPVGLTWQQDIHGYEQFANQEAGGRVDLNLTIDSVGRSEQARSDFASVYGDWDEVSARASRSQVGAGQRIDADVRAGLRLAESNPAALADPANDRVATALMSCEGEALATLAGIADAVREQVVGNDVTYVVNRNINFTNVCYTGCRFCAFAQRETDADAFTLSLDEVGDRVEEAWVAGATEVCMQGGIHPSLPGTAYFDLAAAVKARVPQMHLHAFSPMEVVNGANRSGMSIREWLTAARDAGLDSIPGTAAEILDDEIRWVLTKGKLPTAAWVEVVSTAHEVGLQVAPR